MQASRCLAHLGQLCSKAHLSQESLQLVIPQVLRRQHLDRDGVHFIQSGLVDCAKGACLTSSPQSLIFVGVL